MVKEVLSQDLVVGDVVEVKSGEQFPCDLLLLLGSGGEQTCSVTTANLDGETSIKTFESPVCTRHLDTTEQLAGLIAVIQAQAPDPHLYDFKGRLQCFSPSGEVMGSSLTADHLLLRGAALASTATIYGVALYTGKETKMALNSKLKTNKFSTIERSLNRYLLLYLLFMVSWIATSTVLKYHLYGPLMLDVLWYLGWEDEDQMDVDFDTILQDGFSFFILYSYLIPISLYVTLELQKFGGSLFFGWDDDMRDGPDGEAARCNTSDLNEELGQIQYLFCDKTGTLTENKMTFRGCSINGRMVRDHQSELYEDRRPEGDFSPVQALTDSMKEFFNVLCLCNTVQATTEYPNAPKSRPDLSSDDKDRYSAINPSCTIDESTSSKRERSLSADTSDYQIQDVELKDPVRRYQAASPDEKALVEASDRYGVSLLGSDGGRVRVSVAGDLKTYSLLRVLHFDSDRRRMSVVVRAQDRSLWLLVKGADSAVLPFCEKSTFMDLTEQHLQHFATEGLRTLVVARRRLNEEEFQQIDQDLEEASQSLEDRDQLVSSVQSRAERGLQLLGATAVEDELQPGVVRTLCDLNEAGIKVWVVTGDKLETAVSVAFQSGLFQPSMRELTVTAASDQALADVLLDNALQESSDSDYQYRLVTDGLSLTRLLHGPCRKRFRALCLRCAAVLCCRLSPKQKAEVVRLVKSMPSAPVCAAIGDGANDVSMIQEAHVGIGIMGSEGRQAVRCADFAFSRFQFLRKAILVHGMWYYTRVSLLVHYCFYKNVAFITPQLFFAFYSALSTQTIYSGWYLTLFNTTFVALPVLVYGMMEQEYSKDRLLQQPSLYKDIAKDARMTWQSFLLWMVLGLWHASVMFYGLYLTLWGDVSVLHNGKTIGLEMFGTVLVTICVTVCNLKLVLETHHLDVMFLGSVVLSMVGYFATLMLYACAFPRAPVFGDFIILVNSPCLAFSLLLLSFVCLLPDGILVAYKAEKRRLKEDQVKPATTILMWVAQRMPVWCRSNALLRSKSFDVITQTADSQL